MTVRRVLGVAALLALAVGLVTWLLAARLLPGLAPAAAPAGAPRDVSQATLRALTSAAWLDGHALAREGFVQDSLAGHALVLLAFADTDPRALAALPVVQAWAAAYAPCGVRVVAMHSPAYAFGADSSVTGRLARRLALTLPIALDPDGRLVASLGGLANGPRVIVLDADGRTLVDTAGVFAPAEEALARLVARLRADLPALPAIDAALPARVREIALGAGAPQAGPLAELRVGDERVFTAQFRYQEQGHADVPYPVGGWRVRSDGVTATRGGAAEFLSIRYSGGRAGVVMSPPPDGPVRVWLLHDDHWPRAADRDEDLGIDGRGAAYVDVREPRLYWIDRGSSERVLKLSPDREGLTVHAFVATDAHRD